MLEDLSELLLQQAWEHVRDNAGGPGVDGVTVSGFGQSEASLLPELRQQMLAGQYIALPLRKILLRKRAGSTATRMLLVPTVRDRVAETAVARLFARSWEEEFVDSSYAYRPGRGVDSAVARILQLRERGYGWVVDADIVAYFDNIPHGGLLKLFREETGQDEALYSMVRQWVRTATWDGKELTALRRGIPQGSPLSPLLANFYLTPLDLALSQGDQRMVRYADDFLVLCRSAEAAGEALRIVQKTLSGLGLSLHPEKTRLTSFQEGFRFLGVRFGEGEPLIPWKQKDHSSRVLFVAPTMPQRLLREWRLERGGSKATEGERRVPKPELRRTGQPGNRIAKENDMAYLYITQPGGTLRKSGDRFLLEADGSIVLDLPYHRLEHILVFGNIQVTSQAMAEALDHGIALSIFSRQGRYRGSLQPPSGRNVLLRMEQYNLYAEDSAALAAARVCVLAKLENSALVLERYRERRPLEGEEERAYREGVEQLARAMAGASEATNLPELLGHEGAGAKAYFGAVMLFQRSEFRWDGRKKHPAPDPLNALLSLGYTMIMNEISALAQGHGLDPGLGFYHELDGSRPSLALDLMEPFRGLVIDRFVLLYVNRRQCEAEDFERRGEGQGLFLKPEALRHFLEAYERWMLMGVGAQDGNKVTYREILRREVNHYVDFVMRRRGEGVSWAPLRAAEMWSAVDREDNEKEVPNAMDRKL